MKAHIAFFAELYWPSNIIPAFLFWNLVWTIMINGLLDELRFLNDAKCSIPVKTILHIAGLLCHDDWWYLSLIVRKLVFGVSNQVRHKQGCTATEDG